MFGKFTVLAAIAGLAAAYHVPVGDTPVGNPISNPLNSIAPAGEPLTITWTPTTPNKVSLILLKGPSTNAVYYETIVESIDNTGSYTWTPETKLPGTTGNTGYGIQLIDDITGQYQYSTQFGIKNEAVVSSSSSAAGGYPVSTPVYSTPVYSAPASSAPTANSTVYYPTSVGTTSHYVASTGYPVSNSSIVYPTKSMTVPSSLKTTATPTAPSGTSAPSVSAPAGTGAASPLRAGLGLAGAMAAAVFVL
ncbi:Ser-Thr-rich glycosyl-phosphatidyl-inositol-anchored membrane family-domain-containing protein [Lophiotrema nucula]|uniref:Ser-Thr-rich glycosyl-phosphatidyl-inositol-anchored membrane family-domain-containing protein n=1 Tax=Lophiotrema nucula TaxID=690887 RepID=A0A6A5ZMS6_9PLEO|nr:Ser-Thr-rich glycosyl-phosphatidyl-inositol-anchored membrane family-domain-containing protein [Lophiotrema nucula]